MSAFKAFVCSMVGLLLLQVTYSSSDGRHLFQTDCEETGVEDESSVNEYMVDKWRNLFKVNDLNHDKTISRDDMKILQNGFINAYNLEGAEADNVKHQLSTYWNVLYLNGIDRAVSVETFLKEWTQSYVLMKDATIRRVKKCNDVFVGVVDHDKDGYVSFCEEYVVFKAFNLGNRKLAKKIYRMMCPDTDQRCPLENASDFWTENLIGDDQKKYMAYKNSYKEADMPLDDLVE